MRPTSPTATSPFRHVLSRLTSSPHSTPGPRSQNQYVEAGDDGAILALMEEMETQWGPRGSIQWPQWWYRMEGSVTSMVDNLVESAASESATAPASRKEYVRTLALNSTHNS
mgnify:CR=1 FL=1